MLEKKLFLFDLGGTLVDKNDQPKPYAKKLLNWLQKRGKKTVVLTNRTKQTSLEIEKNLEKHDLKTGKNSVFSAARATKEYLTDKKIRNIYLIGTKGLRKELSLNQKGKPQAVVVGHDQKIDAKKIEKAIKLVLLEDALLIAPHVDRYDEGYKLTAGPIVKAIEYATGTKATVIGKPSKEFFKQALAVYGKKPKECVMIGDNVSSDIVGAKKAKIESVLISSEKGEKKLLSKSRTKPDHFFQNLGQLLAHLEKEASQK